MIKLILRQSIHLYTNNVSFPPEIPLLKWVSMTEQSQPPTLSRHPSLTPLCLVLLWLLVHIFFRICPNSRWSSNYNYPSVLLLYGLQINFHQPFLFKGADVSYSTIIFHHICCLTSALLHSSTCFTWKVKTMNSGINSLALLS